MPNMLSPSTSCFLQGGQLLRLDSRLEIRDSLQNVIHKFPIADSGAIGSQGEFYYSVQLTTDSPSFTFDETLTGFTGATSDTDIDLLYLTTSSPIFLEIASGIPLNSVTPGSRNPYGGLFDVKTIFLLKSNSPSNITLETAVDQRLLPFTVYLQDSGSSATITAYMARFDR